MWTHCYYAGSKTAKMDNTNEHQFTVNHLLDNAPKEEKVGS